VTVPFFPGRTDASQNKQMWIISVLEPQADGFNSIKNKIYRFCRRNVSWHTVLSCSSRNDVLVGGMRVKTTILMISKWSFHQTMALWMISCLGNNLDNLESDDATFIRENRSFGWRIKWVGTRFDNSELRGTRWVDEYTVCVRLIDCWD
jgi:catalase (peroxidase I)